MTFLATMGQEEYQELSSFLKRFVRRFRFLEGIDGICLTAICALVLFALGPGIFYLRNFFPYAPLVYALLSGAVLLFLAARTLMRIFRRFSHERAAIYIEEKQPKLRNNLINSLQLYPQLAKSKDARDFSATMVLALLRSTRKQLLGLRTEDLIDSRSLKAHLRLLGFIFVPVVGMVLFNPSWVGETFSLLSRPLDHLPPSETTIEVNPKGIRVARGSPVTIQASASGAIPKSLELMVWAGMNERGEPIAEEKLMMENLGEGKFTTKLSRLEKTVRYRALTGAFSSPIYTAEAIDPPEVGNVQITLYPPAYTGLGSVTVPGGSIEGIRGSSIRVDAASTKEVVKAEILLDDGKRIPLKPEGQKLQGNLVLFQSQQYQILVEDSHGFRNSPIAYELKVKPDGFPTIDLLRPTEDLEVNGDEILPLEYSARDDFGVGEINLAVKIGERQDKIRLQREDAKRLILRDQYKWDLAKLALRDGEEAIFHLEVLDNDTVSGPKLGTSRVMRLRLKNLRGEHQQVAEMVRDLNSRMVDLLGDHLEAPRPGEKPSAQSKEAEKKFEQNLAEALKRTEEVLRRTEKDRLSDFAMWSDLDALKRNLQFTKDELLQKQAQAPSEQEKTKVRDEISSELERMSLLSEDIGKRMKAQELASTARDLARSQEQLMDALDKHQVGDKNLDSILKQISELGKVLSSLQQALSQFAQQMPDDFMNMDSMRGLGFNEMFSALDEIRKKLMQGDIEGARQLARELFNQMASLVASLQNSQRSAMSSAMGRMQAEMSRSASELQQIAREQQEILLNTEGLTKSALSERDNLLKEKLERFLGRAKEELGQLTELFPDREGGESGDNAPNAQLDDATMNHLLKNLIAKLLNRDFPGYGEGDQLARKELAKKRSQAQEAKARRTENSLSKLKAELDAIMGQPAQALNDSEKKELRGLGQRQEVLQERTRELQEKLESLFQLFPSLDPKIVQNIGEAGTSMGTARDRLGKLDAQNAVPPERDALDRLSQSQQQMQSAMQQLAQRGQLGNMPVPMVFQRGRFLPSGMLVPLPGVPQFPEFNVEGGVTGLDMERFRLPGKEDYKAPRTFREEILDSLKQGVPPQHKDQIERYFKNLTE
jgi:soluble cytochrome b562